jgi:hypothetical protein
MESIKPYMIYLFEQLGPSILIFAFLILTEIIEHLYNAIFIAEKRSIKILTIPTLILIC